MKKSSLLALIGVGLLFLTTYTTLLSTLLMAGNTDGISLLALL